MKKRLIWDLDGTLIEGADFYDSVRHLLEHFEVSFCEQDIQNYLLAMQKVEEELTSYQIKSYSAYLSKNTNLLITPEMIKYYLRHAERLIPKQSVNEDIIDFLKYAKDKYESVILTNYFTEAQRRRVELMGIDHYFSEIYGGDEYIKPDELAFRIACGNVPPRNCIMIGNDYKIDIEGAKKAGLNAIWYNKNGDYNNLEEFNDYKYLKKIL